MNAIVTAWSSLPYAQFKKYPAFYLVYDSVYFLGAIGLISTLQLAGYQAPSQQFAWWHVLLLPLATYLVISAHMLIHNASHGNCGPKPLNRLIGELCGIVVLSKFASWEIIHRRHHRYSDDPEKDPHPAERNYWRYVVASLANVEKQLQMQSLELFGDTPARRRYEKVRSIWSFVSGATILAAWYAVLGAPFFFVLYLPAFFFAALFIVFFNWAGHNAHRPDTTIEPTNLDHGIFWILNRMFFGIFYHGNHHKMAMLFNPMKMPKRALREAEQADEAEAELAA